MKLVMDEKLKHRLIGLAVIISLGAIFAPAVMKKSSQHLDNNFSVNVKLPSKPLPPDVVMTDEKELFKTIKVAKVELPSVSADKQLPALVKAESIQSDINDAERTTAIAQAVADAQAKPIDVAVKEAAQFTAKKSVHLAVAKSVKVKPAPVVAVKQVVKPKVIAKKPAVQIAKAVPKPAIKKDIYAVQLASFSQLANAQALVNKLHGKGYKANFIKIASRQGPIYKVYVGHSPRKNDVQKLKTQLASAMQLNGFVVNTGVS